MISNTSTSGTHTPVNPNPNADFPDFGNITPVNQIAGTPTSPPHLEHIHQPQPLHQYTDPGVRRILFGMTFCGNCGWDIPKDHSWDDYDHGPSGGATVLGTLTEAAASVA